MNQQDRKLIAEILAKAEDIQSQLETLGGQMRDIADAEQGKFDNMPEGLQASERGQMMETAAGILSEAADALENGDVAAAVQSIGELEQ